MNLKNKPGIYIITNKDSEKFYVGSTNNLHLRQRQHFNDLRNNTHHCRYLQNAYNKYGEMNFIFSILEFTRLSELLVREQWYLDYFEASNLYNICITAGSQLGIKRSKETGEKISKALTGKKLSPHHCASIGKASKGRKMSKQTREILNQARQRGVSQIDMKTGMVIKVWESTTIAAKQLMFKTNTGITMCCKGRYNSSKGFKWAYA